MDMCAPIAHRDAAEPASAATGAATGRAASGLSFRAFDFGCTRGFVARISASLDRKISTGVKR
jgi:hypothetical protein